MAVNPKGSAEAKTSVGARPAGSSMATTEGFATTYDDCLPPTRPSATANPGELFPTPIGTHPTDSRLATTQGRTCLAAVQPSNAVSAKGNRLAPRHRLHPTSLANGVVVRIPHAAKVETLASRMPSGCGFLIAAGNPWPHGTRLA